MAPGVAAWGQLQLLPGLHGQSDFCADSFRVHLCYFPDACWELQLIAERKHVGNSQQRTGTVFILHDDLAASAKELYSFYDTVFRRHSNFCVLASRCSTMSCGSQRPKTILEGVPPELNPATTSTDAKRASDIPNRPHKVTMQVFGSPTLPQSTQIGCFSVAVAQLLSALSLRCWGCIYGCQI